MISQWVRFFRSLFPEKEIKKTVEGVWITLKLLLGRFAPFATKDIFPKFLVKASTIRLVSLNDLL
tara:strand:- start:397 stop:591 length:195 start_codon:yes stop_codon:yes gene_type:complete